MFRGSNKHYSNQDCRLSTCEKWCKCEQGLFWLLEGPGSEAMKALAFVGMCSHTVYHLRRTTWVSSCQIWNASGIQMYIVYIVCQWVHIQYYTLLNWILQVDSKIIAICYQLENEQYVLLDLYLKGSKRKLTNLAPLRTWQLSLFQPCLLQVI